MFFLFARNAAFLQGNIIISYKCFTYKATKCKDDTDENGKQPNTDFYTKKSIKENKWKDRPNRLKQQTESLI